MLVSLLFACASTAQPFAATFAAEDVTTVQVVSERGDVRWISSDTLDVHVSGALTGPTDDLGDWSTELEGGVLRVEVSPKGLASSELVLEGPPGVSVEITATSGQVWLDGLTGSVVVDAGTLEGRALAVHGRLTAAASVDVEVTPGTDGLTVEVGATSRLAMPYGLEYDVNIACDEGSSYTIDDLGFEDWDEQDTTFSGQTGGATVDVTVTVSNGTLTVEELPEQASTEAPAATR
jgi:hypothetical protein